jgi:transcriptional regulator with XRE-family HTH domain
MIATFNGQKLTEAMNERGLSILSLRSKFESKKKTVSERTVINWMKGYCDPGATNLKYLSMILRKPMEFFFD